VEYNESLGGEISVPAGVDKQDGKGVDDHGEKSDQGTGRLLAFRVVFLTLFQHKPLRPDNTRYKILPEPYICLLEKGRCGLSRGENAAKLTPAQKMAGKRNWSASRQSAKKNGGLAVTKEGGLAKLAASTLRSQSKQFKPGWPVAVLQSGRRRGKRNWQTCPLAL